MVSELILAEFRKLEVKVVSADGDVDLILGNDDPPARWSDRYLRRSANGRSASSFRNSVLYACAFAGLVAVVRAVSPMEPRRRSSR
jgi:hypothetical protein